MSKHRPSRQGQRRINPIAARLSASIPAAPAGASLASVLPVVLQPPQPVPANGSDVGIAEMGTAAVPVAEPASTEVRAQPGTVDRGADAVVVVAHADTPLFRRTSDYSYRVVVTGAVAESYTLQASIRRCDIEDVMEDRLAKCSTHVGERTLWLSESEVQQVGAVLGATIFTTVDLLTALRRLVEFRSPYGPLVFSPQQLERVRFRCVGSETPLEKLQEYCSYGVNLQTGLA